MIYNERQYKITSRQISDLTAAREEIADKEQPEWLKEAELDALTSQISELIAQQKEYDLIKGGTVQFTECSDLSALPDILVRSRISKGLSQRELGERLGLTMQQVQRYEATSYMGASLARLIDIAKVLDVTLKEAWGGSDASDGAVFVWQSSSRVDWNQFPLKEMTKRGWLDFPEKTMPAQVISDYFVQAAGPQFVTAMHRKKYHGGRKPNEYSLLAWQARVLELARHQVVHHSIADFEHTDDWMKELVNLSKETNGPALAKEYLAKRGVVLVVEEHLQGTYLDGAAMLLETGHPVIGMTLRHDRLDNFWFVLMHELGHVFLHLYDSLDMDFFDEGDGEATDGIEMEADQYALDQLISPEKWDACISRFSMSAESIAMDAESVGVHPAIIAGRVRKETNNYTMLSDLVGQGKVRVCFEGIV